METDLEFYTRRALEDGGRRSGRSPLKRGRVINPWQIATSEKHRNVPRSPTAMIKIESETHSLEMAISNR